MPRKEKLTVSFEIPIRDCNLWTPKSFLYELQLATEGDDTAFVSE
jgi:hypothetical protein